MSFIKVKKDYLKLINDYGYPDDMTGGFVDAEKMEKVILNPTRKKAEDYMKKVIQYGFQSGEFWETEESKLSIHDDNFLNEMYECYVR